MSELSEAINEMRNMRESYDQIGAAAEAYNTGKTELAANITAKGVQASASETLPELAEKVSQIAQTETIIDGGDMYAAQLFGDGALWNLYEVLAEMKTRFMGAGQYAALIVCEYYKSENGVSYDSLQLQGADAYYTCDGDFYDTSAPLHTWHDSDNGRVNRWICFLFATEGARLDITNTAISPRSMYIGGHIGTIEYFVNGRLTSLVGAVEDTDYVDYFLFKRYTQAFGFNFIMRGVKNVSNNNNNGIVIPSAGSVVISGIGDISITSGNANWRGAIDAESASSVIISGIKQIASNSRARPVISISDKTTLLSIPDAESITYGGVVITNIDSAALSIIDLRSVKRLASESITASSGSIPNVIDMIVGNMEYSFKWIGTSENIIIDADKKAQLIDNIKNHILARVGDRTGLSQLTFTVSTNMFNAISAETITWNDQTMTLADAFLTKNWLLAGA